MADTEIKEGDQVSWQWGGGAPGGKAVEVATEGEVKVTSHRGNEIKKNAEPENPAVHIARSGNDVVKKSSELDVQKEGPNHKEGGESKVDEKKDDSEEKEETNDDAKAGDKRKADESAEEKKDEESGDAKKQKTGKAKENGEKPAPKKKGRPAKKDANGESAPKKETKKKEPKKAPTATGEPRRSGRNRS